MIANVYHLLCAAHFSKCFRYIIFHSSKQLYKLLKTDVYIKLLKITKGQLQCDQLTGITTGFKVT